MGQKTVLILGSSGKVARLVRAAILRNPIKGIDFKFVFRRPDPDADYVWTPDTGLPAGTRSDAIIALWGVTSGDDETLTMNRKLAFLARKLALQTGATQLVHCSSVAVYGPLAGRISENEIPRPVAPYGRAKLEMEQALANDPEPRLQETCLRLGNIAGADSLFASIRKGVELTLDRFPDGGGPLRAYLAPTDLVRFLYALLGHAGSWPKVMNVAAPAMTPMEAIARAAGCTVSWRPAPASALQSLEIDTSLMAGFLALDVDSANAEWLVNDWKALDSTR